MNRAQGANADIADILKQVADGKMSREASLAWVARELAAMLRTYIETDREEARAGGVASGAARTEVANIAARFFVSTYKAALKERGGASAAFRSAKRAMKNIGYERTDRTYWRWLKKLGH